MEDESDVKHVVSLVIPQPDSEGDGEEGSSEQKISRWAFLFIN